jgi:hypothetical protein
LLKIDRRIVQPTIPATVWSFTNGSDEDIVDAALLLEGTGSYLRYIQELTIPAGETLTVLGPMKPEWKWAFGGVLKSGSPVFAFNDFDGTSPLGLAFDEVFNGSVGDSALGAALLAHLYPKAWDFFSGGGVPLDGFVSSFAPPVGGTTAFNLYAFSNGRLVGSGTASPFAAIPEPSSLMTWSLLATVGVALVWWRRRGP